MKMRETLLASALVLLAAPVALADGGDIDIGSRVTDGRLVSWAADHTIGQYLDVERVFKGELTELLGVVEGDEPGWFFRPDSEFVGSRVGFNVLKAARAWDPNAPSSEPNQNFQSISPVTFTIGNSLLGEVTTPAADPLSAIAGPSIVVPSAGVDFHYPFLMNGNTPGIYLLELEQYTTLSNVQNSLPFYVILNYGLSEEEHDRAFGYVSSFIVPAPGAIVALAMGGLVAARRRRA